MRIKTLFRLTLYLFGAILLGIAAPADVTRVQVARASRQPGLADNITRGASEPGYLAGDYFVYRERRQLDGRQARYANYSTQAAGLRGATPEQAALARNIRPAALRRADADRAQSLNMLVVFAMIGVFGAFLLLETQLIQRRLLRAATVSHDAPGREVEERLQAEEALRASEERYRTLFDSMDEGYCIIEVLAGEADDPADCRILEANPAFEQQTGLTGARGRRMREMLPELDGHWFAICDRIARTGVPERFEGETTPPGRWYSVYAYRFGPAERRQVAVLFTDITARRQAETVLLEADREKDEFLAVVSHELQTPLTSMLGWSSEALRTASPDLMARAMPIVHRNAQRQKRLVDELLEISRLIHRRIALDLMPAELGSQARLAAEAVRPQAEARGLRVTFVAAEEPLPIDADAGRLQQCLGILLNNSVKFTPDGGTITVHCRRDGDAALAIIEDTGRGIAPKALPTLFHSFRQVERNERFGGLGLGLAIAHRLIILHGGSIRAESDGPDRGSRFTIALPLAGTASGAAHLHTTEESLS